MDGAIGFGPSTLSDTPHLLAELEVPLLIPQGFLNPNSPPQNGVYSPDPAFWGATISNDTLDPPASAAIPDSSWRLNFDQLRRFAVRARTSDAVDAPRRNSDDVLSPMRDGAVNSCMRHTCRNWTDKDTPVSSLKGTRRSKAVSRFDVGDVATKKPWRRHN